MGGIIAWIVLGLIAGAIAKAIYPGTQGGGFIATTALGIVGAVVGGYLAQALRIGGATAAGGFSLWSIALAVVGAIVVLFVWGLLTQRAA
ncbi:MAG: GlsB/YeaQ/YmgE family stress response membrane protein [Microcoleus sp. PH2017_10_PVI_O_A]|uniref:GlsB/YeaQ/YmgE family stress response membrane protein n=1 Tax=unclassified Microcoleus TaxID=2642155 RepID=UPI001D49F0DF|nr:MULTISPECIES: GlsB/YeaQ/YmgE family stress response membrane protein [unclassified Microcoleus]TAE85284.1 MAG: GlsB/YeaQ/YmgE family stress response membrane protein [Oscillatoriales cyanobacterium]MCC3406883.1 GlsB/YeaQ/YmgE family stress response membrane protein [Microcoleus sp. PH2017_10_PVI_O_A]MCC3458759.1 GlsB/YeaQ/YmgE family stress response membrane protein [Microcoleus sp. PH2017_11_PCY_U_A]MCC3476961.1 GlsB/YeaQ/YmgE family stress response membrane protein [Microcoleus sp. PH2017_